MHTGVSETVFVHSTSGPEIEALWHMADSARLSQTDIFRVGTDCTGGCTRRPDTLNRERLAPLGAM